MDATASDIGCGATALRLLGSRHLGLRKLDILSSTAAREYSDHTRSTPASLGALRPSRTRAAMGGVRLGSIHHRVVPAASADTMILAARRECCDVMYLVKTPSRGGST